MPAPFNPFARSAMKIPEPLVCLSCEYDGWARCYKLEYRASRAAANVGKLQKQFKQGTPLFVQNKNLVVRSADFTVTNGAVDEVTVRVEALDFQAVLAGALAQAEAPASKSKPAESGAAPSMPLLRQAPRRKLLLPTK